MDGSGTLCVDLPLRHGVDPRMLLAEHDWTARSLMNIGSPSPTGEIALDFRVSRGARRRAESPAGAPSRDVNGAAKPHQRVAAYAVVRSTRGLLLSEASARTGSPGTWALPGGGLERGEGPDEAVLREVWEETGQHIQLRGALDVSSQHWVGAAPNGTLEDFHAVRLVYLAHCPNPTDPVVHDIGGTTESSAWVSEDQLTHRDVSPWARALLTGPGAAG